MTLAELWTVLRALPWAEGEARKIVADAIIEYEFNDPYEWQGEPPWTL